MPFRLLAIDIDGTLLNSRDELTRATRAALVRAQESGIRRGVSHRPALQPHAPPGGAARNLGAVVTATGALVKDPRDHRTLYRAEFEPEVLRGAVALVAQSGCDPVLYGDTFCDGFDFFLPRLETPNPALAGSTCCLTLTAAACGRGLSNAHRRRLRRFRHGGTTGDAGLAVAVAAGVGARLSTHVLRSPKYDGYFCELAPGGVTKWSAILRLAEAVGDWSRGDLRGRGRRQRHPHDSLGGPWRGDGQRAARGQGGRRPRCANPRRRCLARVVQWMLGHRSGLALTCARTLPAAKRRNKRNAARRTRTSQCEGCVPCGLPPRART